MNKTIFIAALSLFVFGCGSATETSNSTNSATGARSSATNSTTGTSTGTATGTQTSSTGSPAQDVKPPSAGAFDADVTVKVEKLVDLKMANGHTAKDVAMWESKEITGRLEKLLAADYAAMKKNWNTESPAVLDGDTVMLTGCQQNNCGSDQYVLVADLANDNINVIHIKGGKAKDYKEKGNIKLSDTISATIEKMKANSK